MGADNSAERNDDIFFTCPNALDTFQIKDLKFEEYKPTDLLDIAELNTQHQLNNNKADVFTQLKDINTSNNEEKQIGGTRKRNTPDKYIYEVDSDMIDQEIKKLLGGNISDDELSISISDTTSTTSSDISTISDVSDLTSFSL